LGRAAVSQEDFVMMLRRRRLAAVLMLSGCYRYVPTSANAPIAAGSEVRLTLTPAGSASLTPILGRDNRAVDGHVSSVTENAYVIAVSGTIKRQQGSGGEITLMRTTWAGESVAIPRTAVEGVELRSLDAKKTGFVAVLGTALTIIAVKLVTHVIGSSGSDADGGTVISP
jgi:hypothetical protein